MIDLKVKDYCQTCPVFEPKITRNPAAGNFRITCEHAGLCKNIEEHLKREMEKKNESTH